MGKILEKIATVIMQLKEIVIVIEISLLYARLLYVRNSMKFRAAFKKELRWRTVQNCIFNND